MRQLLTGAEIFVECLEKLGVNIIFGYPGGPILDIYDKLINHSTIKHILVRHEQGATHMAEGYAKITGKVGVVLVSSGPGVTNTVTGIADAFKDSIPIIVFAGQVPYKSMGRDNFQEVDSVEITKKITKKNFRVTCADDFGKIIYEAFSVASSGKPGPVLVEMPANILKEKCEFEHPELIEEQAKAVDGNLILKAAEILSSATRPILIIGGGVINAKATDELRSFAEKNNIPVIMTLHGLGSIPASSELCLGMLGAYGTYQANQAVSNCDVMVGIGLRFDNRATSAVKEFSPHSYKIHIDIDGTNFNKNIDTNLTIPGDAKDALQQLSAALRKKPDTSSWLKEIGVWKHEWRKDYPLTHQKPGGALRAAQVIEKISERTKGDAIMVTDVGQFQMITAQHYQFEYPRTQITSGGLGTMGFALPAAIGVAFARPQRRIICVNGDGGIQMNMQELTTAKIHHLPIIVIIINNHSLGMVRQVQGMFFTEAYEATDLENPNFVKILEGFDYKTFYTNKLSEVDDILNEAFSIQGEPVGIVFDVLKEDLLFPIVPASSPLSDMIVGTTDVLEVQKIKEEIIESLAEHNMISKANDIISFEQFNQGLINYIFAIRTREHDLIVKHARDRARGKPSVKIDPRRIKCEFNAINLFRRFCLEDHFPKTNYFDEQRMLIVMDRIPDSYSLLDEDLKKGIVNIKLIQIMGQTLAEMHNQTRNRVNRGDSFDNIAMIEQLKSPIIYDGTTTDPEELRELAKLKSLLLTNRVCFVHGDFKPNNIFANDEDFIVIDFEQAHYGDPTLDFVWLPAAYIIISFLQPEKQGEYFAAVKNYWEAYQKKTELPFDESVAMQHLGAILLARVDGILKYDYLQPRHISSALRKCAKKLILRKITNLDECLLTLTNMFKETAMLI